MSGQHSAPRRRRNLLAPKHTAAASGTAVLERPAAASSEADPAPSPRHRSDERATVPAPTPAPPRTTRTWLLSVSLLLLSVLLLGFVVEVIVVSQVQQARNQQVLMSDFRSALANGVAPVGQTDSEGALLAPGTPVGILSIPKLGIEQVVVEGTASGDTAVGPGHRRDTPLPGQVGVSVLYGRQAAFGGPFGDLGSLAVGDEISVTTGQGIQKFAVLGLRRPGDPLQTARQPGESRLLLMTADGTTYVPDSVLRVDAKLVGSPQPASQRVLGANAMTPAEQPMAGDSTAWVGVVLWAQALLVGVVAITWCWVRWGHWQAWVIGVPVLGFLGLALGGQIIQLLPNLM